MESLIKVVFPDTYFKYTPTGKDSRICPRQTVSAVLTLALIYRTWIRNDWYSSNVFLRSTVTEFFKIVKPNHNFIWNMQFRIGIFCFTVSKSNMMSVQHNEEGHSQIRSNSALSFKQRLLIRHMHALFLFTNFISLLPLLSIHFIHVIKSSLVKEINCNSLFLV